MRKTALKGTGGGSYQIQIDYEAVAKELDAAIQTLKPLKLPTVFRGINGSNQLQFIEEWLERENEIRGLLELYQEIVEKNLVDTKVTAELLKLQDEELAKRG